MFNFSKVRGVRSIISGVALVIILVYSFVTSLDDFDTIEDFVANEDFSKLYEIAEENDMSLYIYQDDYETVCYEFVLEDQSVVLTDENADQLEAQVTAFDDKYQDIIEKSFENAMNDKAGLNYVYTVYFTYDSDFIYSFEYSIE